MSQTESTKELSVGFKAYGKGMSFMSIRDLESMHCSHRFFSEVNSVRGELTMLPERIVFRGDIEREIVLEYAKIDRVSQDKASMHNTQAPHEVDVWIEVGDQRHVFRGLAAPHRFVDNVQRLVSMNRRKVDVPLLPSGVTIESDTHGINPIIPFPRIDADDALENTTLAEVLSLEWFSPVQLIKGAPPVISGHELPNNISIQDILKHAVHDREFLGRYHIEKGDTNVTVSPVPQGSVSGSRLLTCTTTTSYAPWRTTSSMVQGQRYACGMYDDAEVLLWHHSTQTPNITAGATFRLEVLVEIVRNPKPPVSCIVNVYAHVNFSTPLNPLLRARIETTCIADARKSYAVFLHMLSAAVSRHQHSSIKESTSLGAGHSTQPGNIQRTLSMASTVSQRSTYSVGAERAATPKSEERFVIDYVMLLGILIPLVLSIYMLMYSTSEVPETRGSNTTSSSSKMDTMLRESRQNSQMILGRLESRVTMANVLLFLAFIMGSVLSAVVSWMMFS